MMKFLRRLLGRLLRYVAIALALAVLFFLAIAWNGLGTRATGARRERMERSRNFHDGHFVNPQPIVNGIAESVSTMFHVSPYTSPKDPIPTVVPAVQAPPASGLRVTWLGHSATLVEIDGHRILTDPLLSDRASPIDWVGPRRWYPSPIAIRDLPALDAVVISHDHYDHLDHRTIEAMKDFDTKFIVPLGVGANLAYWGVPESKIVELDWWDRTKIGDLEIVLTPTRHASGRGLVDKDAKLWGGYALLGATHRVYYSGDSGLFPALADIGEKLGPFDLTMIEVGQYDQAWPDWHMGPEQAVRAHEMVRGKVFLPVHWGAIALAGHSWTEPVERALAASLRAGVTIVTPKPGESFEPSAGPPPTRWWPSLPWRTAQEYPIVSSQMN